MIKLLPFKKSQQCTLGIELELQIIDPSSYAHVARARELIKKIQSYACCHRVKPEITQSMIEINSSIHTSIKEMEQELILLKQSLIEAGNALGIIFCGGGTHPTQSWPTQKIYPTARFKNLTAKFRYLSKRSAVFALHVHVGCSNRHEALYLTHALTRYVPQLIAISASSPFYQGVDTCYASSRVNIFNSFPLSGVIPFLTTWKDFSDYYYLMKSVEIIRTMKDFYWDIRPKPEFGTVEIRVCDTPLTFKKALLIAAYIQSLACYLLQEKPIKITKDLYYFYTNNRFEASRYGFNGLIINPATREKTTIQTDILSTLQLIKDYSNQLGNDNYLLLLMNEVMSKRNDADYLRNCYHESGSLTSVMAEQCKKWIDS